MRPLARLFSRREIADRARAAAADEAAALEAELSELPSRTFGRAELPSGTSVTIASPCTERWEAMAGDERVRHCSRCDNDVYNLSALRADEVEALLAEHGVRRCVRMFRRADGTMLTADCPVGRPQRIAFRVLAAVAIAVGATAAAAYVSRRLERGKIDGSSELLGDAMPTS